ncbi:TIGR03009 domain-containing protein [Zavarzinella formosa]|uniref:TIGR03009 domain-containing protein n=1 Tax=Zavarzinella formosa TaxID=360055 RepID=UPI0002D46A1E|nr:TIGR03009 domain-containing protein [Zavarzinella formosa]
MRWSIAGLVWLGLMAVLAMAQAPVTPGTPTSKVGVPPTAVMPNYPPLSERSQKFLDAYLKAWEDRMKSIEGLETKLKLTEIADKEQTVYNGEATIMRPNFAKMFLRQSDDPTNAKRWRHYIADGSYLWDYQYKTKVAKVAKLPKENIGDNTLLSFMFGMKADEIKKRYHITVEPENPDKFNEHYVHLMILPKTREDMQEFAKAELVLWKNNKDPKYADYWMLPARLWFQHPNKNQVIWEFNGMNTQKKLIARDFSAPAFPDKEWTREWAVNPNEKQLSPTTVRQSTGTLDPIKK